MADASVRAAGPGDVAGIARIQLETWRLAYGRLLPAAALEAVTRERAEAQWAAAVSDPPTPRHRVLVALERDRLVGFAAFGPAGPDASGQAGDQASGQAGEATGEIVALLVEPRWGRRGHGSRLLAATVDHLRADGMGRAVAWVLEGDRASVAFYESAGWQRDGYVRGLDAAGEQVREVRLHASLAEPPAEPPAGAGGDREGWRP